MAGEAATTESSSGCVGRFPEARLSENDLAFGMVKGDGRLGSGRRPSEVTSVMEAVVTPKAVMEGRLSEAETEGSGLAIGSGGTGGGASTSLADKEAAEALRWRLPSEGASDGWRRVAESEGLRVREYCDC